MTTTSLYPQVFTNNQNTSFFKQAIVSIAKGTVMLGYGLSTITGSVNVTDQLSHKRYDGTLMFANGSEVSIFSGGSELRQYQTGYPDIEYNEEENEHFLDDSLWTENMREAIPLNSDKSSLYNFDKTVKSKVINAGQFVFPSMDTYGTWDETDENVDNIYRFERIVQSKVIKSGEFKFPPLD